MSALTKLIYERVSELLTELRKGYRASDFNNAEVAALTDLLVMHYQRIENRRVRRTFRMEMLRELNAALSAVDRQKSESASSDKTQFDVEGLIMGIDPGGTS